MELTWRRIASDSTWQPRVGLPQQGLQLLAQAVGIVAQVADTLEEDRATVVDGVERLEPGGPVEGA